MGELAEELGLRLRSAGLDPAAVVRVIRAGLAEDLADGPDVTTTATIPPGVAGTADVVARGAGVVAGLPVAEAVFHLAGAGDGSADRVQRAAAPFARSGATSNPPRLPGITCKHTVADGELVTTGTTLMTVTGPLAEILTAERTALNILCHLSGIATLTRRWVDAVSGTAARIRDTRKTLPGLRALEKYAVRCGGGGVADLAEAVSRNAGRALLEASGGLRLTDAAEVAATGVDFLAVGALTHSAPALDIGLDLTGSWRARAGLGW